MKLLRTFFALIAISAVCPCICSQDRNGGISESMLSRIREGYKDTPAEKAVRNALAGQSAMLWQASPLPCLPSMPTTLR